MYIYKEVARGEREKLLRKAKCEEKKRKPKLELFLRYICTWCVRLEQQQLKVKKMVFHIVLFGLNDMNE